MKQTSRLENRCQTLSALRKLSISIRQADQPKLFATGIALAISLRDLKQWRGGTIRPNAARPYAYSVNASPDTSNDPKNFTIFGSRLFFFLLAPWLFLGVIVFVWIGYGQINESKLGGALIAAVLTMCCLCGLLFAISQKRFGWTVTLITGSVAIGYIWYFCDTYFVQGQKLVPSASRSEATPWNALIGFLLIGLPCMIFTIRRIKSCFVRARKR